MNEPRYRWYHKVSALIFIVFCLELGMFLVVFPWSDFWDRSFFPRWLLRGASIGITPTCAARSAAWAS